MKLVDILQGKWLGHPLHPVLVHIPIGAWLTACLLDVTARAGAQSSDCARLALYLVGAGLLIAAFAVPTGLADWSGIKKEKPAWKLGLYHLIGNAIAATFWGVNFALRLQTLQSAEPVTLPILITSVAGTLLVAVSGYLGKLMVYDQGISVARTSKQKWRVVAERGGARVPPAKEKAP
jgi:uncharacterized membrane protein